MLRYLVVKCSQGDDKIVQGVGVLVAGFASMPGVALLEARGHPAESRPFLPPRYLSLAAGTKCKNCIRLLTTAILLSRHSSEVLQSS